MNKPSQWLFEAPFALKATHYQDLRIRPPSSPNLGGTGFTLPNLGGLGGLHDRVCVSPDYVEREYYNHPEQGIAWELYEEEYRRHNRKFRREMAIKIGSTKNHPLKFLVKPAKGGKWLLRTAKDLRVDAGHVTPVVTLQKRGHKTERLAIQDRKLNRSDGGKMAATGKGKKIQVIDIGGVPVDIETAKKWAKKRLIDEKAIKGAPIVQGWTPNQELFFALGEAPNWVSGINHSRTRFGRGFSALHSWLFEAPLAPEAPPDNTFYSNPELDQNQGVWRR